MANPIERIKRYTNKIITTHLPQNENSEYDINSSFKAKAIMKCLDELKLDYIADNRYGIIVANSFNQELKANKNNKAIKEKLEEVDLIVVSHIDMISKFNKKEVLEVALGGGETTLHPEFINILKEFYDNKVIPNFTTKNHNLLRQENAQEILKYCGAIAFSVENSNEMKKVILSQKQRNIENKIDLGYISYYNNDDKKEWTSKVVFQIVLGVQSEDEFKKVKKKIKSQFAQNAETVSEGRDGRK